MNYSDMLQSIRIKIDDERKTRFPGDTQLRISLNEAAKLVYRELIKNGIFVDRASTTISFTANNQEIAFSSGIKPQKIIKVLDEDGLPIPIYSEEFSIKSNRRSVYFIRSITRTKDNNYSQAYKLGWYVEPNSSFDVTVIYVPSVAEFTDVLDSRSIGSENLFWVPEEHHDVVVLWAVVFLLGIDEEAQTFWGNLAQRELQNMVMSSKPFNESDDAIVDVMSDDGYYLRRDI